MPDVEAEKGSYRVVLCYKKSEVESLVRTDPIIDTTRLKKSGLYIIDRIVKKV